MKKTTVRETTDSTQKISKTLTGQNLPGNKKQKRPTSLIGIIPSW